MEEKEMYELYLNSTIKICKEHIKIALDSFQFGAYAKGEWELREVYEYLSAVPEMIEMHKKIEQEKK